MTTLIAWAAIDQNNTSAVYIASDSRFTWDNHGTWDAGRKIYASEKYPEILGYTGDVLFCSQVLSQVIAFIDSCAPLENAREFSLKYEQIESLIKRAFSTYPKKFCLSSFSILYLTRIDKQWGACTFRWNHKEGWLDKIIHRIPMTWEDVKKEKSQSRSVIFVSEGSGGEKFRNFYSNSKWSSDLSLYSRGIFGAFCDFIETNDEKYHDPLTGGTPQISGLYRNFNAQKMGFVKDDNRYIYGIVISPDDYQSDVRWVNRTFENCEPLSGKLISGEQRQPAPK